MKMRPLLTIHLVTCVLVLARLQTVAAASPPKETALVGLLPEKVVEMALVPRFSEAWETEAAAEVRATAAATPSDSGVAAHAEDFRERFGLDPARLAETHPSLVLRARIAVPDQPLQGVMIGRMTDRDSAERLLAATRGALEERGANATPLDLAGITGTKYTWPDRSEAVRAIIHATVNDLVICATDASLAAALVENATKGAEEEGGQLVGWDFITSHITLPCSRQQPSLLWYSDPAGIVEASNREDGERYAWMERHGLTGIQAVGGLVTVKPEGGLLAQTVIAAPEPRQSSLRMLRLIAATELDAPDWLCQNYDELVLLHGDVPEAFEHIGKTFDELYADGIAGTYEAILQDLGDEAGLDIDLKSALYHYLGPQVLLLRHEADEQADGGKGPVTYAFQTSRPAQVAQAVRTLLADDPEVRSVSVPDCQYPLWVISGGPGQPDSAAIVTRGYLVYAADVATLRQALAVEPGEGRGLSTRATEFQQGVPSLAERQPCLLWARDGKQGDSTKTAAKKSSITRVFLSGTGPPPPDESAGGGDFSDLVSRFLPLLQEFSLGLGFVEEDGWSLLTR
ncbi:MAG: hypothetical protein ACQESR_20315 [Planctomycetota bacterium]